MQNLRERAIRGGVARACALAGNTVLRLVSMMVLARILDPKDFGLIGMVTAFTGVLSLFRDFGLSAVTVQRASITKEQSSTLFWVNVLAGGILAVVTLGLAPVVTAFYHEPRLFWITVVSSIGFLFNGAGVQHSALLQRQMRFTALALIDMVALFVGTLLAIGAAKAGAGYWALVTMTFTLPFTATIGYWLAAGWVPGLPHRHVGLASMMRFGGTMTMNGLLLYLGTNTDKVLLGRFWGTEAIGIYGRAYQLIRIPTDSLNAIVGEVAFSTLSRVQHDSDRLKRYFLRGYSLVLALTVPLTVACALFADDMILVFLGPKWKGAVPIFRLLTPTILVFAILNPLGWLLNALGMVGRGLRIAMVLSPVMIGAYIVGLPWGPRGVAFAYSVIMSAGLVPLIAWPVHGTVISFWDVVRATGPPFASIIAASAFVLTMRFFYGRFLSPLPRLTLDSTVLLSSYFFLLLFVAGQKSFFLDLLRGLKQASADPKTMVSA
jgi:O-antigen/teichoic acid export membrane protein